MDGSEKCQCPVQAPPPKKPLPLCKRCQPRCVEVIRDRTSRPTFFVANPLKPYVTISDRTAGYVPTSKVVVTEQIPPVKPAIYVKPRHISKAYAGCANSCGVSGCDIVKDNFQKIVYQP